MKRKRLFSLMVSALGPLTAQYLIMWQWKHTHNGDQEVKRGKGVSLDTSDSRMTELLSARFHPLMFSLLPSHPTGS